MRRRSRSPRHPRRLCRWSGTTTGQRLFHALNEICGRRDGQSRPDGACPQMRGSLMVGAGGDRRAGGSMDLGTDTAKIARWYDLKTWREWERTHTNCMEFAVTLRAVREHAPRPPGAVLDIGGGPGRYAIALAEQGYDVTLFDLSTGCLAFAQQQAAERGVGLARRVHGTAT